MEEHKPGRGIKDLNEDERPRERLVEKGAEALRVPELIAILLGSGTTTKSAIDVAEELFEGEAEHSLKRLATFDSKRFQRVKGIGPAKAVTLLAAFELARRKELEDSNLDLIGGVEDAYRMLRVRMADQSRETVYAIFLSHSSRVKATRKLGEGTANQVLFDIPKICRMALELEAQSLIVAHNHPGGSPRPSQDDITVTLRLQEALSLFSIRLIDHLVITQREYSSLRALGHLA